jgi:signal transduction histidine kinase/AmiR/NasT family two-component response regulator
MLPVADPALVGEQDPELHHLIQAERIRMLLAPTMPVAVVSALCALALAAVLSTQAAWAPALTWASLCAGASLVRIIHLLLYRRAAQRDHPAWLSSLAVVCVLHGLAWGTAGMLMPVHDLVASCVIVTVLVTACAICTFTLQAHLLPNLAINLPMLLPAVVMLISRQDVYGIFGGLGTLTLLVLMLFEGRRAERRITELLWLRFTTDRIAKERAEALKLAQRHSAVKDQFLATMSHEMRTPLHGILGLARLVHERLPERPGILQESRQQLALIERTGEHLLDIINDVLDFSRIEAGKLQIEKAPFDLQVVVADVLNVLRVSAREKGLSLNSDIALPSPCWVMGDAARVRQMLHNLVGNAIKFTDVGGVRVRVERPHNMDDASLVITVKDTGIGIAPEQLPLVFDAFHQADGSFGRRHKGTGLGLTISREIARSMGGDLTCASKLGTGSAFTLTLSLPPTVVTGVDLDLPLDEPAPIPAAAATVLSLVDHDWSHAHVLLAEDNPVNALVAEATLAKLGLQVTRVEDGQQALDALRQASHPYHLVLMDCQMPVLDGLEATRRLREWEAQEGRPRIPVVALTANAMTTDRQRCMDVGMDAHLGKPFRPVDLQALLQVHLSSAQQARTEQTAFTA